MAQQAAILFILSALVSVSEALHPGVAVRVCVPNVDVCLGVTEFLRVLQARQCKVWPSTLGCW